MRIKLGITLLGLCVLASLGIFIARSTAGFSESQLARLDQNWTELLTWGGATDSRDRQGPNLELCAQACNTAREAGGEATTEFARWQELLASGVYTVASEPFAGIETMKLAQQALESESVDASGVGQILALARRLQGEGPLISFMVGVQLTQQALERCRSDADLIPAETGLSAPEPGELFAAICRDFGMLPSQLYPTDPDEPGSQRAQDPAEELLMQNLRATHFELASQYFPLRDHPERFAEVPPPQKPGWLIRVRAILMARPADMRRVLAPLVALNLESHGNTWAQVVSDWKTVLGS